MIPMIDPLTPGMALTVLMVGPGLIGITIALVAGVVWAGRATAEEMRRMAAREWDARTAPVVTTNPGRRLAA
jgi:hypothetical protein